MSMYPDMNLSTPDLQFIGFDLPNAKARLNIASNDTTKDVQVMAAMNASVAIAEAYCDRKFSYKSETATFIHDRFKRIQLKRWPIISVSKIADANGSEITGNYHIHHDHGYLQLHGYSCSDEVKVTYEAGYKVLPAEIEIALWSIFDTVYASLKGSGAGFAGATGGISSINVPDVGSISFSQSGGGISGAKSGNALLGTPYGPYLLLLDAYKDLSC